MFDVPGSAGLECTRGAHELHACVILISGSWLHRLLGHVAGISPSIAWMPHPHFQFLIFFLALSFADYWNHRVENLIQLISGLCTAFTTQPTSSAY